jgi:hypothetical protein
MDTATDDLSILFFKKSIRAETTHITMDADMIRLLVAVDENKDMSQIAKETGLDEYTLRDNLAKLLRLGLIEPVSKSIRYLDRTFHDILSRNLTLIVGPMGDVILDDILADMGISAHKIPVHRAAELIRKVGEQIPDQESRSRFEQTMLQIIPA